MTTITPSPQTLAVVEPYDQIGPIFSTRKDTESTWSSSAVKITLSTKEIVQKTTVEPIAGLRLSFEMFRNLDAEVHKVLKEIGEEAPWILNKEFDFTNTGEEIEVVDHNLTDSEYLYVKAKLNANKTLVRATDYYNQKLADKWNEMPDSSRDYTKEDAAGRIRYLDAFDRMEESLIRQATSEDRNGISRFSSRLFRHNNNHRGGRRGHCDLLSSVSMQVQADEQESSSSAQSALPKRQEEIQQALKNVKSEALGEDGLTIRKQAFEVLDKETHNILKEIGEEAPWMLDKKFDFTNTGNGIEVIDHDLTNEEYLYLTDKLNSNEDLVNATDYYNRYYTVFGSSDHETEDGEAVGISFLDMFKRMEEDIIELSKDPFALRNNGTPRKSQDPDDYILTISLPLNIKPNFSMTI